MTGANLAEWQAVQQFTQARAAESLGVSLATYKRYLTADDVPQVVALACAALAAGLPAWR